jgi:hypothetical protein
MSHTTAPTGHTVTQMNTNTTQQIAKAVNIDNPNTISIATNTNSTEQIILSQILQNDLTNTLLDYGTIEANNNTTLQFAIAVNYDSPGSTAIATNVNFTEQVNGLTAGAPHGGTLTQVNHNSTVEIDIALNIDSPDAVAIAGNGNVTEQVNGLTTGGTAPNGNVVQLNSNTTIQFGIALDINSPGAIALASSSNTTIQENLLGTLLHGANLSLADLGLPSFISDTAGAGPGFGVNQHGSNYAGFVMADSTFASSNLAPVHPTNQAF